MIHLVFGVTAKAGLKLSFEGKGHQIIGFPVDFSIGPINNIHKNGGINNFFTWLKSTCHTAQDYLDEDRKLYEQALQELLEIKDGGEVTVWTCENATEQIGLRIVCFLLREKRIELNVINSFKAMRDFTKCMDYQMYIRHTGECSIEKLQYFYENSISRISEHSRQQYEAEGENLLNSESLLRIWEKGAIVKEPESKLDSFIMKCAKRLQNERQNEEFIDAKIVVGIAFGESEYTLSDAWVEYRVRSLIESGQLAYEGDLKSFANYKIKVVK